MLQFTRAFNKIASLGPVSVAVWVIPDKAHSSGSEPIDGMRSFDLDDLDDAPWLKWCAIALANLNGHHLTSHIGSSQLGVCTLGVSAHHGAPVMMAKTSRAAMIQELLKDMVMDCRPIAGSLMA
jgi:hypothetical protein